MPLKSDDGRCGLRRASFLVPLLRLPVERQRPLPPDHGVRAAARNCSQTFLPVCVSCSVPPFHSIQSSAT